MDLLATRVRLLAAGVSYRPAASPTVPKNARSVGLPPQVERLVRGSAEGLALLYEQPMQWAATRRGGLTDLSAGRWAQDDSPACRQNLLLQLPMVGLVQPSRCLQKCSAAAEVERVSACQSTDSCCPTCRACCQSWPPDWAWMRRRYQWTPCSPAPWLRNQQSTAASTSGCCEEPSPQPSVHLAGAGHLAPRAGGDDIDSAHNVARY